MTSTDYKRIFAFALLGFIVLLGATVFLTTRGVVSGPVMVTICAVYAGLVGSSYGVLRAMGKITQ
jgi:hypothetical protein